MISKFYSHTPSAHAKVTITHLVQEASGGSRWGTLDSFLNTQVVKELACLWKDIRSTKVTPQKEGDGSRTRGKKTAGKEEGWLYHDLTVAVVTVSWRKCDSHNLLKVTSHAQSPERWREVNFIGLSLWTIRVIRYLISSSDVLYHPCSKAGSL